jgi:hypothetical protein
MRVLCPPEFKNQSMRIVLVERLDTIRGGKAFSWAV